MAPPTSLRPLSSWPVLGLWNLLVHVLQADVWGGGGARTPPQHEQCKQYLQCNTKYTDINIACIQHVCREDTHHTTHTQTSHSSRNICTYLPNTQRIHSIHLIEHTQYMWTHITHTKGSQTHVFRRVSFPFVPWGLEVWFVPSVHDTHAPECGVSHPAEALRSKGADPPCARKCAVFTVRDVDGCVQVRSQWWSCECRHICRVQRYSSLLTGSEGVAVNEPP